jgi:hypothetical protein
VDPKSAVARLAVRLEVVEGEADLGRFDALLAYKH